MARKIQAIYETKHKIDITPLLKGENITDSSWAGKEQAIQEEFIWGVGPEALYQITRAEYKTEPDSIKVKDLIRLYTEYYLPKRNTYHNRGDFFWAKQSEEETPEEFWRRLIEIEKECIFGTISAEELLISKYMTAITVTKLQDKIMKEKTLELKKVIELIKQNTYEKKNKKNTIPEALISSKEKQIIKEEPIQRMESFGTKPRNRTFGNRPCRFCNAPNWSPIHKCPAIEANCNKCGKKGHFAKACRQRTYNNRTVKRLTEDKTQQPNESTSESEESIHHIKEVRKIEEKNKHYTATIKINGVKKEFIIDTGSPITIMPPDEKILKSTKIQKITNRYQNVNKNEVKFRGKIPVNVEYENNKQKMEILITERADITPVLGMDWMKSFKLTIGRIQLAENNQSEKENYKRFPDLFENNKTIKDTEIKIQLKPGHYPVKQKARPVPLHLQEDVGRELEKLIKSGHLEKIKDVDEDCFVSPVVITVKIGRQIGEDSTGLPEAKR